VRLGLIMLLTLLGGTRLVAQDQDQELEREADRGRGGPVRARCVGSRSQFASTWSCACPEQIRSGHWVRHRRLLYCVIFWHLPKIETAVRSAQEVEPGRATSSFSAVQGRGDSEVRSQTLLLAYRRGPTLVLVELRVST
jgi:hypothetical protein